MATTTGRQVAGSGNGQAHVARPVYSVDDRGYPLARPGGAVDVYRSLGLAGLQADINVNHDGSTTAVYLAAKATASYTLAIEEIVLYIEDNAAATDVLFGAATALTRGMILGEFSSVTFVTAGTYPTNIVTDFLGGIDATLKKTIAKNADIKRFVAGSDYASASVSTTNCYVTGTFRFKNPPRITGASVVGFFIQDDLSGLVEVSGMYRGYEYLN